MAKKKKTQDNVSLIDDAINDKGTVNISMKAFKYIIILIIGLSISILGVAWGFKAHLESKFEKALESHKIEFVKQIDDLKDRVNDLEKVDVKPNTKMNYRQDGDIKTLYDRTNSRQDINSNAARPDINTTMPTFDDDN